MHFYYWYAVISVLNYPASGENRVSVVSYFKNPLIHIQLPVCVENQGVANISRISKCKKTVDKASLEVLGR